MCKGPGNPQADIMSGGIAVGLIGWIFAIVTCVLPMWRITTFIGANIVLSHVIWEGLWMSCVLLSTGQMQCKVYDAILILPSHLQAGRIMTVISIITAALSLTVSIMVSKCTSCTEDKTSKRIVMIVSGIFLMIAGNLMLIPVSWATKIISKDFYNPVLTSVSRIDHGASLYTGFIAAFLFITGGALLCCTRPPKERRQQPTGTCCSAP